jgi:hypothetical protein
MIWLFDNWEIQRPNDSIPMVPAARTGLGLGLELGLRLQDSQP